VNKEHFNVNEIRVVSLQVELSQQRLFVNSQAISTYISLTQKLSYCNCISHVQLYANPTEALIHASDKTFLIFMCVVCERHVAYISF